MDNRRGFVLIIVMVFVLVLAIGSAAIYFMVNSELIQVSRQVSQTKAFYAAEGGSEILFASISSDPENATYQQITGALGGYAYAASTGNIYAHPGHPGDDTWGLIKVSSTGTVNGIAREVEVEYEVHDIDWANPSLMTSGETLELQGHKERVWFFWVYAGVDVEGPVASGGDVTVQDPTDAVTITGQKVEDVTLPPPQFMQGFDANRDDGEITDTNGDGEITYDEIPVDPETGLPFPDQEAIFLGDDVNGDNVVNEKDGFTHYYTKVANYAYDIDDDGINDDLGMDPDAASHPNYYSGNQTFGPGGFLETIPADTNIVFVDGDVDIVFNPDSWGGGARDITVVSTGDTTIVEPCNGDDDRLTLINYGDVATGGINVEFIDIIDSNLNVYAHGDFYAYYGGDTEGTLSTQGVIDVDTIVADWTGFLYSREIGNNDNIIEDPPIGLPPMDEDDTGQEFAQNFCRIPVDFIIENEPYSWDTGPGD
jgi:hypothetical protein